VLNELSVWQDCGDVSISRARRTNCFTKHSLAAPSTQNTRIWISSFRQLDSTNSSLSLQYNKANKKVQLSLATSAMLEQTSRCFCTKRQTDRQTETFICKQSAGRLAWGQSMPIKVVHNMLMYM